MSAENVELVRRGWDAYLGGDFAAALELSHPDVVAYRAPPLPDPKTYHGREGVLQMYADWTADFDEFEMGTGEYIDAGERVIVEVFQRGTGQASGVSVEGQFWFVFTVVEGQVTRQDVFNSREQALAASEPAE